MTGRRWLLLWVTAGVVMAASGALLMGAGLERADKYASVVAAAAGVIGVLLAVTAIRWPHDDVPAEKVSGEASGLFARDVSNQSHVYQVRQGTMHVHHGGGRDGARPSPPWFGPAVLLGVLLLVAAGIMVAPDPGAAPASVPSEPEVPLHVAVDRSDQLCDADWVSPKSPQELQASRPVPDRWREWEPVADGAEAGTNRVLVTVQASTDSSVTLTGLRVSVNRTPPLAGTLLVTPCGDAGVLREVEIDLDQPRPVAVGREPTPGEVASIEEAGARTDPVRFPYEVTKQDAETFLIVAKTTTCLCTWTAELSWSSAGRSGTATVTDGGKPFRVTPATGSAVCHVTPELFACET